MTSKIYSEFLGTFVLVFIGVGAIVNNVGLLGIAVAHGLAIAVMVSALAGISSAHFNPAVSFGFFLFSVVIRIPSEKWTNDRIRFFFTVSRYLITFLEISFFFRITN